MSVSITEDFTATGTSAEVEAVSGAFVIAGTFDGTVELQRLVNDVWAAIASFTAPTSPTIVTTFDNGVPLQMRFEATVFSSGAIECDLEGTSRTITSNVL